MRPCEAESSACPAPRALADAACRAARGSAPTASACPAPPVLADAACTAARGSAPTAPASPAPPPTAAQRQAEPIRRIVRDLRPRARVLAVASGKGGVGKTNLAVNLAIALSAAGRRVLLVDADLGLANVDLVLGLRPRGDLGHVLAGRLALEDIVQEGPAGIRWIPGASYMPAISRISQKRREALLERLTALETEHDFVLLDAPAGVGQGVLHLARQADELLLVTTPEPPAMIDAYALLKAMAAAGAEAIGQVRLIVNMVACRRDGDTVWRRIAETSRKFLGIQVDSLGSVFCDGHVGRAVQRQEPLLLAFPHSQAAWCIKRLSGAVLEGIDAPEPARFGFFRRLANFFVPG